VAALPLTLAFPLALMLLMLVMERVEQPLRRASVGEQLEAFFDSARPEDVEVFVSEGAAPAPPRPLAAGSRPVVDP
jgi:hypothetical protein